MAHERVFGRRGSTQAAALRSPADVGTSSPVAEYVRAAAEAQGRAATSDFADWRRAQRGRWLIGWALGLLFMSPGLLCFLVHAPLGLSVALEVAGVVTNAWVGRERKRRLHDIVQWEPPDEAP